MSSDRPAALELARTCAAVRVTGPMGPMVTVMFLHAATGGALGLIIMAPAVHCSGLGQAAGLAERNAVPISCAAAWHQTL